MSNLFKIIILAGLLLSFGGCKKSDFSEINIEENDFIIAQIDTNTNVMASELYRRLVNSNVLRDGGYLDSSTYFDTLFSIVIDSISSLEAWNVKVEDYYSSNRRMKNAFQKFYVDYLFNKIIIDPIKVDTPQVTDFYQSNLDEFKLPQQFRVSHLMVSAKGLRLGEDSAAYKDYDDNQLDSISQALLSDYRTRIDSTTSFGDLAFQYSMHRGSGKIMGDLGFFERNTYATEFEAVVCTLSLNEVSSPFQTRDGWHLAQLTDFIDSTTLPLDTVYQQAYNQVLTNVARETSYKFMDSISKLAEYKYNDSALAIPPTLVDDSIWAISINDRDTIDHFGLADYLFNYKKATGLDSLTLEDTKLGLVRNAAQILIMQAGDDLGYNNDSEVVKQRRDIYHQFSRRIVGARSTDPGFTPPDSEIEEYYNLHIDDYIIKKPINVQHIIVEDSIFGEFLRDQAMSGVDFLELAKEHYPGAEEIRVAAADLGYIGEGEMPDEFYKLALRTGKGTVSHPVKTEWGYHIIYVVDKQMNKTLEQVRHQISSVLRQEHQLKVKKEWQQDMLNRHTVTYFLDKLEKLKLPSSAERKK